VSAIKLSYQLYLEDVAFFIAPLLQHSILRDSNLWFVMLSLKNTTYSVAEKCQGYT